MCHKYFIVLAIAILQLISTTYAQKEACLQEKIVGSCRASLPRWFYNSETKKCEFFQYGGCDGNENNFKSQQECDQQCMAPKEEKSVDDVCSQPQVVGPCRAMLPRWFFNTETKACEMFFYGGCHGNSNNFEPQQECESKCAPQQTVSSEDEDPCKQPKNARACRATQPRWFYNTDTAKCQMVFTGHCNPKFSSRKECESRCVTSATASPPTSMDDDDGQVIIVKYIVQIFGPYESGLYKKRPANTAQTATSYMGLILMLTLMTYIFRMA